GAGGGGEALAPSRGGNVEPEPDARVEPVGPPRPRDDASAGVAKRSDRRRADPARPAGDDRRFALKRAHGDELSSGSFADRPSLRTGGARVRRHGEGGWSRSGGDRASRAWPPPAAREGP